MDRERLSTLCAIALNSLFGDRPGVSRGIMEMLRSCGHEDMNADESVCTLLKDRKIITPDDIGRAGEEYDRLSADGVKFAGIFDKCYPPLLRECPDAPFLLYVKGTSRLEDIFHDGVFVSIVGTRDLSAYGYRWCRETVRALAASGANPTIVSGLAFGTDITAHRAAAEYGIPTIAVLPTGIDSVYPKTHSGTASRISCTDSCALVTDYPPGTALTKANFRRRNRIIAGLSRCTVLIESRTRGGGMMTARLASGYGREVYALPGRIDDARSSGCNQLVADKLAEPLVNIPAFCTMLGLACRDRRGRTAAPDPATAVPEGYAPEDRALATRLVRHISENPGCDADSISQALGLQYGTVSAMLERLDADRIISSDLAGQCALNVKID